MKFTLEKAGDLNVVTGRAPGEVRIGERVFTRSVVVTGSEIVAEWPVANAAALATSHLDTLLAFAPDLVILGTGEQQVFPDPELFAYLAGRGVGFEVMDNGAACRTYNVLLSEGRKVALALLLP